MIQEGLLVLLFLAAVSDIRTSRISNRLVLAGLGMGILFGYGKKVLLVFSHSLFM